MRKFLDTNIFLRYLTKGESVERLLYLILKEINEKLNLIKFENDEKAN